MQHNINKICQNPNPRNAAANHSAIGYPLFKQKLINGKGKHGKYTIRSIPTSSKSRSYWVKGGDFKMLIKKRLMTW